MAEVAPTVTETFWDRVRWRWSATFSTRIRGMTPAEADLERRLAEERSERLSAEARAEQLRLDLEMARSQVLIANVEVEKLNLVIERDRIRVQAEIAAYARRAGDVPVGHEDVV